MKRSTILIITGIIFVLILISVRHYIPCGKNPTLELPPQGTYTVKKKILKLNIDAILQLRKDGTFTFTMNSPIKTHCPTGNQIEIRDGRYRLQVSSCISHPLKKNSIVIIALGYNKKHANQLKLHLQYKKVVPLTLNLIKSTSHHPQELA